MLLELHNVEFVESMKCKGSKRHMYFRKLLVATRAKFYDSKPSEQKVSVARLRLRMFAGVSSATIVGALIVLGTNVLSIQNTVCSANFVQPALSDTCGALAIGDKPTKTERIAWENLPAGDCDALRGHVRQFPSGVYRDDAADLISAAIITEVEVWRPTAHPLSLYVPVGSSLSMSDEYSARADAQSEARAGFEATRVCRGFAITRSFKFLSASHTVDRWNCNQISGGFVCAFDGQALCEVEERTVVRKESCGGGS